MSWRKIALPLAFLAAPALADIHPNTAPGFPVDQSFHVGDVDSVNLFNGALTLTIPIGASYPVNGGFSYSLKLTYNSSPWLFKTVRYAVPPDFHEVSRTQAYPNPCSNAGLGWRVSFGRMNPPCQVPDEFGQPPLDPVYQDENGTDHLFYPTLHYGDAEDTLVSGVYDVQYTRDGSYLRLKKYTAGYREIEFPDGSVRKFGNDGLPTEIRDAFNNKLSISYAIANQWVLTDSQGRTQKVHFRADLTSYGQVIDRIELTTFGADTATYQFNYTLRTIGRACPHNDTDQMNSIGSTVSVPLLTGVTLPDGSSWAAAVSDYVTAIPSGPTWSENACTENGGNLTGLTLPTLGRMEWSWQKITFPTGSTAKPHLRSSSGVATRTMRNANGTVLGTWTYTHAPNSSAAVSSREHTTTVVDPLGHRTVNYFSTAADPNFTGWSTYEYSLPFTHEQTMDASGTTLNLSRQTYDGPTLLRSEYVLYERDPIVSTGPPDSYNTNRRMVRGRTVYNDDGNPNPTYAGVVSSGFDGLGHYRTQTAEGNFAGGNVRSHFVNYNPDQGTYTVNPGANTGAGYSLFPVSSPWVLEAPSSMSDSEGSATAQIDLCYAPGTPVVTRKRIHRLNGATLSTQDLISVYDLETLPPPSSRVSGNVASEKSYGGDFLGHGVGTSALCALQLPASPEIQIDHIYASGVRKSSKYTGTSFFVLDQTIDPSTGLPSSSSDSAGLQTSYEYDAFGRLTWSKPPVGHGGWTEYVYTHASGTVPPNVIVRRRGNGSKSMPALAVDQVDFDSFGRVGQELKTLPDGTTAKRQTTYDGAGNKSKVSEWTTGSPANFTQFLSYDPFGRPGTIRPADGSTHDVTLTYRGVRQVDRVVKVATAQGSETAATTTEVYDRQGRLISVTEPSGSAGANVTTSYGYDVGNRLASVSTTSGSITQTRGFSYDLAGLLKSETHPEKGASGNGTVTYPLYDSRGHVLRKTDGPHDLSFTYDTAERLAQVQETGGRLLKSFTYAPANGTNDWRQGKLQQASRYNYLSIGTTPYTVKVDETYTYGGRDGRVSQRDTQASTGESFTQGFTYNDLGLVSSLTYPTCTHAGCTQPAPAVFADVPVGYWAQLEIEAIRKAAITMGCLENPLRYCPEAQLLRSQMAVFLVKAAAGPGYTPPGCTGVFADVPCPSQFADWIEDLYHRGITAGCAVSPLRYCPDSNVSNTQMTIFLLRSKEGASYQPPPCSAPPLDVSCSTTGSAAWIVEAARRQIAVSCSPGFFCPDTPLTRAQMAVMLARGFDFPITADPNTSRMVQLAYTQGLLTGVTGYGILSYYPNLMVSQITHGNGVTETQGNDPNQMRRPSSLSASGLYANWTSGTYGYDGAGNIKTIGASWYAYDKVSRLVSATLYDGPTGGGTQKQQSYTFDAFGNLTNIAGTSGRATPTSAQTNRLNGGGTIYDAAGNLTNWNGAIYQYDAFNQMTHMTSGQEDALYLYTADDERLWSYDLFRNVSHWAVRDLGGKVLREYQNDNGRWSAGTDYIYRDGLLLAAETPTGQRHFHLDHLGTPRLITRASGYPASYHVYYPFGEEATALNQDTERMKFTGHERDLASPAGVGDDLDYMHARHESPVTYRFLSFDPELDKALAVRIPQKWNRYSYVLNNPMKYNDLDGRAENYYGGGTVINSSHQDIYIAFDADQMNDDGSSRDIIIALHRGESSKTYTTDADAVIVTPGQDLGGATDGSIKISAGTVEIVDGDKGKLIFMGDRIYFDRKQASDPKDRAGYQSAKDTPAQWKITKSRSEMEKDRKETSATAESRAKRTRDKQLVNYWKKVKSIFSW